MRYTWMAAGLLAAAFTVEIGAGSPAWAEPLLSHPAAASAPAGEWNAQLGRFGESLVREFLRARGHEAFNLNVGPHGIDALVRMPGPDGRPEYRVIEVKTVQAGTDFPLHDTRAGRQLCAQWIEDRLAMAARGHADPAARKAAAEALEQFRRNSRSVRAELHGVSVAENRYVIRAVDPFTGTFEGAVAETRVTAVLERLSRRAGSEEVRRVAASHLAQFDQFRAAAKPRLVRGEGFVRSLGEAAGVHSEQAARAVREASEHIVAPGQSRWVAAGGKVFRFVGKAAGPAGVVIGVAIYTAEAARIEQQFERGELTREQADAEQAKLVVRTVAGAGGAWAGGLAGEAIGTFLCPGPGTVVGGIVGAVGGCVGAELVMAATGLTDTLGEFLAPGVGKVREACAFLKERGLAVTVAAREQVRAWVGPEVYYQAAAALDSAVTWTGGRAQVLAETVRDRAAGWKDGAIEGTRHSGEAVSEAAGWTWGQVRSVGAYLRR